MSEQALKELLQKLQHLPGETEIVEFKEAKNGFDFRKLGKYFSALSNEANLKRKQHAWLVFGIENKKHKVVGSNYRSNRKDLDSLKEEMAQKTGNNITFIEIHELFLPEGRVVFFQIPAAPKGIPVSFAGHYYGRNGEALSPLNLEEIERIRWQANAVDWSAAIVPGAGLEDLDEEALWVARKNYRNKFPNIADEVDDWDELTFLNKAKVTLKGKITRTAIILLGKDESEHFINPAEAKIRWILKDSRGNERDYLIVSCPLLLGVDKIYAKIRNIKYRYMPEGTLFPDEMDQYEPFTIREAINNSIAHQDYRRGGRINVVEMEDQLVFSNLGSFIPGSVENVIRDDAPEEHYRNKFLATAMFNLNMVETIGSGIRKMFNFQRVRYFPMPDYELANERVKVTIQGKVLDVDYARILARNPDLTLEEIIMLDKVQKRLPIVDEEIKYLRSKKLIEGRKPNFFLSRELAQATGQKGYYMRQRGIDDEYCRKIILDYLNNFRKAKRTDFEKVLLDKLPDVLNAQQKKNKIKNNLQRLRIEGVIKIDKGKHWILTE